jgi:hypothetical protein
MRGLLALTGMLLALTPAASHAAPVEFVVDPNASSVTVSGTYQGHPLSPQLPGSDTAAYQGTLPGDLAGGMLTLRSTAPGSVYSPMPLRPGYPDANGTQEASYGFTFATPQGTAYASIRRLYLYIGNEYGPPMDVSTGTFVPADAGFFVSDGGFDVALPGAEFAFEVDLHGSGAPNTAAGPGTILTSGGIQTITIPLATTFTVPSAPLTLSLNGQIVATRVVPEPACAAGVLGLALLLARRRRIP